MYDLGYSIAWLIYFHSQKLEETTGALKVTHLALEHEKAKTDTLLYEMLPRKVADTLKHGQKVITCYV